MIRALNRSDMETCVQLLIAAYNAEPWNNHWTVETAARYLRELADNEKFVGFVICEKDAVVGAMLAHCKTWWTNDELFVDEFFVAPQFQRQGFGTKLLAHAEAYAQAQGLAGLTLLTNRYFPAKAFYAKHGYVDADHVVFMYKEL